MSFKTEFGPSLPNKGPDIDVTKKLRQWMAFVGNMEFQSYKEDISPSIMDLSDTTGLN